MSTRKMLKKSYAVALPALAIVLIIAMTGFSTADSIPTNSSEFTLSVTGTGTMKVKSDEALINLGVMTQAVNASDAVTVNAEK